MAIIKLTEEQWEFVQRFIPTQYMGRPRTRDKECFEAILYQLRTGCQWELLPNEYPPKSTVHRRYLLWKKKKVFYRRHSPGEGNPEFRKLTPDSRLRGNDGTKEIRKIV